MEETQVGVPQGQQVARDPFVEAWAQAQLEVLEELNPLEELAVEGRAGAQEQGQAHQAVLVYTPSGVGLELEW